MPTTPTLTTFFGVAGTAATSIGDLTHLRSTMGELGIDSANSLYIRDYVSEPTASTERVLKITSAGSASVFVDCSSYDAAGVAEDTANGNVAQNFLTAFTVIGVDDLFVGVRRGKIYRITGGAITAVVGHGYNQSGSTLGGYADGPATTAMLDFSITSMAMVSGNLWFFDFTAPRIRKVDGAGNVSTVAGSGSTSWANGTGTAAAVGYPRGGAVADRAGNYWFWGGSPGTYYLAKCTSGGVVTTQVSYGSDVSPGGICLGADGNIWSTYNSTSGAKVDKYDVATSTPTTVYAWTGDVPANIVCDSAGNLYVSVRSGTHVCTIQKIAGAMTPVAVPGAPSITLHPTSTYVSAGASVTLRSAATGSPTPTVQWQKVAGVGPSTGLPTLNGILAAWPDGTPGIIQPGEDGYPDPLAPWANISGATSSNYTFTAAGTGATRYKAVYHNSYGDAITNSATVTVSAAPGSGDLPDLFDPGVLVPSSDVLSPGAGTPGAVTRTPSTPGSATILALVREFSAQVRRAIRITGPTHIAMVDPAASNSLLATSADTLYSVAGTAKAASTQALAVLHGTVTTTASASLKTNDVALLLSGWQLPDRLPVRGIGNRPVKSVQMTFTPHTFTADVTFHVG